MFLSLLRLWLGPLPKEEIFPNRTYNPIIHWFFHPLKRRLAKYYLAVLQKFSGLTVIGITGSAGKTTTKDMLFSLLKNSGPTQATTANITPTYNIPTTILRCTPATKYLILEMGIEYIGDMDFYLWLARPDIAIITSVGPTHLQHFKDIATVALEKNKIGKYAKHLITFADVKPGNFNLPKNLVGSFFQTNAALAAKTAQLLGIKPNFKSFVPPPHRMNLIKLPSGSLLIDDTYNANPLATPLALEELAKLAKKTHKTPVFVFGQMNELGQYEKLSHEEIGRLVKKLNIKNLYCLGPATKYTIAAAGLGHFFENQENLYQAVKPIALSSSHIVLIKGSRSWYLESLVAKLTPFLKP